MNQVVIVNGLPNEGLAEEIVRKYFKHFTATYNEEENGKVLYLKDGIIPVFITSLSEEETGELFRDYISKEVKEEITSIVLSSTHTIYPNVGTNEELLNTIETEKALTTDKDKTYFIYMKTNDSVYNMVTMFNTLKENIVICYEGE